MGSKKTVNDWRPLIKPVLDSKTDEFLQLGYSKATNDEVWNCLVDRIWKGNPTKHIHAVVQDVFHLSSDIYVSYLTLNAYQNDDGLMASIAALTGDEER